MSKKYEFNVEMTCEGCSGAVKRVLDRLDGVIYDINLPGQKVFVTTELPSEQILEILKKTGKATTFVGES